MKLSEHEKEVILDLIEDLLKKENKGWQVPAIYNRLKVDNGISLFGTNFYSEIVDDSRFIQKSGLIYLVEKREDDNIDKFDIQFKMLNDFNENFEQYSYDDVQNLLKTITIKNEDIIRKLIESFVSSSKENK